jgi:putative heme-binding domain-containing protein
MERSRKVLEPLFPSADFRVNRELARLLIYLQSPTLLPKALTVLSDAKSSEEISFYAFQLRNHPGPWSLEQRKTFFASLRRAEALPGLRQYEKALADIRREVVGNLPEHERNLLGEPLVQQRREFAPQPPRPFVKEWKMEDLISSLATPLKGRSFAHGKEMVLAAQCVACHRVSLDPALPFAMTGPDLTSVGLRFNPRDLLDHILNPSKVIDEKFRATRIILKNGDDHSGIIESESSKELVLRQALSTEALVIPKDQIEKRDTSLISLMPEGLLNTLSRDEILDLLAFLQSGGNPNANAFRP